MIDTLVQAKQMFPGKRNSLDALCDRFGISNAHRTLHGALLDSELLAEVYLAMTRGQESLVIDMLGEVPSAGATLSPRIALDGLDLLVITASRRRVDGPRERARWLDKAIKGTSVWRTEAAWWKMPRQRHKCVHCFKNCFTNAEIPDIIRSLRVVSSAVEHCLHTAGVTGSIPVLPTTIEASVFSSERLPENPGAEKRRGFLLSAPFSVI